MNSEIRFESASHHWGARNRFRFHAQAGLLIFILAMLASTAWSLAQNNPPVSGLSSNRFLFVVDTSTAMKRMGPDIVKIITEIIDSSASGQLRPGDSLGLWTFNQDVYSELPAQTWNFAQREQIGARVIDFLKHRRFEKTSRFDQMLPDVFDVIHASDIITVFIISNGEGKMKGTPFDAEINAQYQQNVKDMGSQRKPIVTVLQAKAGHFLKFTMNVSPWPVVIPELPLPIKMPPAAQPAPAAVVAQPTPTVSHPAAPPPAPAPLIITNPAPQAVVKSEVGVPQVRSTPMAAPWPKDFAVPPPPNVAPPPLILPRNAPPMVTPEQSSPAQAVAAKPTPPAQMGAIAPPSAVSPPPASPPPAKLATSDGKPIPIAAAKTPPPLIAPAQAPAAATNIETTTNSVSALAMVSPEVTVRSKGLLIAVVTLALVAILLIALILHRYFDTSGPSLITRSMGNKKR